MHTVDERLVRAPLDRIFALAANVTEWPTYLAHYRDVTFLDHRADGGGIVDMAAYRPFGPARWPVWWRSEMHVDHDTPEIRFRHIGGVTTGMDVAWTFAPTHTGTHVRIIHVWNGWPVPLIGPLAAATVIGPIFIHGVASRTLEGLARAAEQIADGT
jgi:ribosome-associated toxin RatA of RatAB toxin-antitoxin module